MRKLFGVIALTATLALMPLQAAYGSESEPKVTEVFQLNFKDIQTTIEERNPDVKKKNENISSLENGYLSLEDAQSDLSDSISGLGRRIDALRQDAIDNPGNAVSDNAQISSLGSSIGGLQQQLNSLDNTSLDMGKRVEIAKLSTEMTNQLIVVGTQNLFFTNDNLRRLGQITENNLNYLNKNLNVLKLRQSLGLGVDLDVKTTEQQVKDLAYKGEQINRQLDTIRGQVNIFIGQDFDHELNLVSSEMVSEDSVNALNYKQDLTVAMDKSYKLIIQENEIEAKQLALEQVERTDGVDTFEYKQALANLEAEKINLEDAKKRLKQEFDQAYNAVQDMLQASKLEQSLLDNLKTKLKTAQLSNQLGLISNLELIGATADYDGQILKVQIAQGDVVKAYTIYLWLVKGVSVSQ